MACHGDFGGVAISQLDETTSDKDNILQTQLVIDTSKYDIYNVTSLGNMARIIVSGKHVKLVSRAQQIYDDYKKWFNEQYNIGFLMGFFQAMFESLDLKN